MNLNFELTERDLVAAQNAVGHEIRYCVPADLTLDGRRTNGYFVIGQQKWAHIENGKVIDSNMIAKASNYKALPLIGNAILEADDEGGKRIIARTTLQHVARFAYIAQILNYISAGEKIRIYNDEPEQSCVKCGGPLIHGTRVCPKCINKAETLKKLFNVTMKYWRHLLLVLVILFVGSGLSLVGPYLQRLLVNEVFEPLGGKDPNIQTFAMVIVGLLLLLIITELLGVSRGRIVAGISSRVAADLRKMVFEKIQNLSLGFITSQRAGDLMNRVTSDTDRIRNMIQEVFTTAVFQVVMLVAVSTLLFTLDWRLALIVILPAPLVALLQTVIWRKVLWRLFRKQWRIYDKSNSFLHDILSGIRVVKSFGKEDREIARFRQYNKEFAKATIHSESLYSMLSPISNYLIQIGQYFVLLVGGWMILGNSMSLGELIQFTAYAAMVYGPIQWMMYLPRWFANALISIDRIFSIIDEQPEIVDTEQSIAHRIHGDIRFNNVTFGYKSYEPVLKNINLEVKQGEMIGLVGHSGSGKSTLINLVSRFYDVNEGEITFDGINVRSIQHEHMRSQIGVVLQETFLFSGTIMENIMYSKPDATMEEVIQAARVANAHDFIIGFPDGYDTKLEENGNNLSGGERQRLAIARAVLNNPRILILDEATASLDIETETAIQEALRRVTRNRTTIAIAHRLSTLRNADRLIVLNKGQIAEVGSHPELMEQKGIYYGLVMAQRNMSTKSTKTVVETAV